MAQGYQDITGQIIRSVIALVDVWDAIRTRRLYDQPMSSAEAKAFIVKRRGTHFDPAVVDAFEHVADQMDELSAIASFGPVTAAQCGEVT